MAASCTSQIFLVIMLTVWQALSVASAARPLNLIVPLPTSSDHEPASALNVVTLPCNGDTAEAVVIHAGRMNGLGIIVPGEETSSRSSSGSTAWGHSRRRGGSRTFGPMFLNFLPKGSMPPSGPGDGTNSLNNQHSSSLT